MFINFILITSGFTLALSSSLLAIQPVATPDPFLG